MIRRVLTVVILVVSALLGYGCANIPFPGGGDIVPPQPTAAETTGTSSVPAVPAVSAPTAPTQGAPATSSARADTPTGSGTTVKPRVDQDKAQSALIAAGSGGKIEIKASGGVTYTLDIPKDALLSDEIITMVPVTQIDGFPLSGGMLGAVELRPEGMRLVKPATLTIQMPVGFKNADLIGFAYKRAGENFHLYPVSAKGSQITTSLAHFSSYGGGQGTQSDSQAQQGRQPTDAESSFENDMGAAMDKARQTDGSPSNPETEDALRRFFNDQVGPDLKGAESNDQTLDAAIGEYLNWARQAALLGMDDRFQAEFAAASRSMEKGLKNAIDKASQRCVQDIDWEQGLKMISRARTAQLLNGLNGFSGAGMDLQDIRPKLDQCWRFRLDYESIVKWQLDDNMDITAHVKSQVTLNMREDMTAFDGEAPLEYVEHEVNWRGESALMNAFCDITTDTTDTTLSVSPMILSMNLSTSGPPQIRGLLDPGDTTEKWSWVCDTGAGTIRTTMPIPTVGWSLGFKTVNKKRELNETTVNGVPDGKPKYLFHDFKPVGKPVIARETGTGTEAVDVGKVTEEYTIDIVHMPKGGANDTPSSSSQTSSAPARKPVGPKTTDASALPAELAPVPAPPDFAVVDQSTTRTAPGGSFQFAQASWWGTGSISQAAGFYRDALSADWNPGDEMVAQSSFSMTFVSKTDSNRTLSIDGKTDSGGTRILETLQQE
jgi:hypothetical protein